jgi:L,D-peptidoglycan transpeptidase YkuD (ErfK/YbiS/YcfS/YnhG family)
MNNFRFLRLWLLLLPVTVFLGCQSPPSALLESASEALNNAAKAGALKYAEPLYREAETLLRSGTDETAMQSARFPLWRDYAFAESLLRSALDIARGAEDAATDSATALHDRAADHCVALSEELETWRVALNGSLPLYNAQRQWNKAELGLQTARNLLKNEEYHAAISEAEQARTALTQVEHIVATYNSDEAGLRKTWTNWVNETVEWSRKRRDYAVVVDKSAHKVFLIKSGIVQKTYSCDLGRNAAHQKLFAGDGATPEGKYNVVKSNGSSRYYKALLLDYPNDNDEKRFKDNKKKGRISKRAGIGALIEIHGHGGQNKDWTEGCVAITDKDMDHLLNFVGKGTPVTIVRRSQLR